MKKFVFLSLWLAVFACFSAYSQPDHVRGEITYQHFYDALSPYGTWIEYPSYGHVWHPNVADFRPYATDGYWEYTDDGWFWVSDFDWGWAPFHYGRWFYDDMSGWLWVPGYEWSPAWVTWGMVDDFYAWAPLAPWVDFDVAYVDWMPNEFYWNIVPRNMIFEHNVGRHLLPADRMRSEAGRVSIINNFHRSPSGHYFSRGPSASDVHAHTGRAVTPVPISERTTAGRNVVENNRMSVYRPNVRTTEPAHYRRMSEQQARPVREGSAYPTTTHEMHNRNIERMPERQSHMTGGAERGGMAERGGAQHMGGAGGQHTGGQTGGQHTGGRR